MTMKFIKEALDANQNWDTIRQASYTKLDGHKGDIDAMYTLSKEMCLRLKASGIHHPFGFIRKAVHTLADTVRGINLNLNDWYYEWQKNNTHGTPMMRGVAETAMLAIHQAIQTVRDCRMVVDYDKQVCDATFLAHTALCVAAEVWNNDETNEVNK